VLCVSSASSIAARKIPATMASAIGRRSMSEPPA
jgi:hypothetical protein